MRIAVMVSLLAAGCTESAQEPISLAFSAQIDGMAVTCGQDVAVGTGADLVQIADARLFLSGISARSLDGEWVDLSLDDSDWQGQGVALLDFEDGTAACADSGTSQTNTVITGSLPQGEYNTLRFHVGVPFEHNHIDSATAPAPLNAPGMFWVWQGGYKFLRVDWMTQTDTPSRWNVHVGSTGCESAAPTAAPDAPCSSPNFATITVEDVALGTDIIAIDLGELVASVDVGANTADTPPGCMSSPDEGDDCAPAFSALGMSFDSGECVTGCDGQRLFTVEGAR